MKAVFILVFVLFYVLLSAADLSNPTTEVTLSDGSALITDKDGADQRIVDTWTGTTSAYWEIATNWSLGSVPTSAHDVVIPVVSNNRYPMVSDSRACRNITVQSGARLLMYTGTLTITYDFNCYGALYMSNASGSVVVQQALYFRSGASTNITASAKIKVQGNVTFDTGSGVNMANGTINLYGYADTSIYTYAATTIRGLECQKSSTYSVYFAAATTATLTINGLTHVYSGSRLYHPYTGTTVMKGNLNVEAGGYCQFAAGTLSMEGTSDTTIFLNDYNTSFNNLNINKASANSVTLNYDVSVYENCTIQSGILNCSSYNLIVLYDLTCYGTLAMDNAAGALYVQRDLFFRSGSSTNITANALISVQRDVVFDYGSSVNMSNGILMLYGNVNTNIYTYVSTTVNNLQSQKNSPYVVALAATSNAVLTLSGTTSVSSGSTLTQFYTGTTIITGNLTVAAGGYCTFGYGYVSFDGSSNSTITFSDANSWFNNLTVHKSGASTVYLTYQTTVKGNLSILLGILNSNSQTIYVKGNWTNDAGVDAFISGTGTVIFNGSTYQYVNGSTNFYNVTNVYSDPVDFLIFQGPTGISGTLDVNDLVSFNSGATLGTVLNDGRGRLTFNNYCTYCIASYTGGAYLDVITGCYVIINDLSQDGIYGTLHVDSAHLEIHQDAGSWIDLNGNMTITNNGIMDIYGGSMACDIAYSANASLSMDSGEFNIKNNGLEIYYPNYSCDFNISGGTIRCNGVWIDVRGNFDPTGGTVELYGTSDWYLYCITGSYFNNLTINKGGTHSVSLNTDITIKGDLTIESGILNSASQTLYVQGNWTNNVGVSAFVPGTGTVIFNGSSNQYVTGSTNFYNVTANSTNQPLDFQGTTGISGTLNINCQAYIDAGATLATVIVAGAGVCLDFRNSYTSTIASYTGGGILYSETGSHVIITDLAQDGLYGSFYANGAHLEVHQDNASGINLNGLMDISNNGIVDIYGTGNGFGGCCIANSANASLTMSSGAFNINNTGFLIGNNAFACEFNISGGTIRCVAWNCNRGVFDPTGGTVELNGLVNNSMTCDEGSFFYNLTINKGGAYSVTLNSDITVKGNLTIQSGILNSAFHNISVAGDWTNSIGPSAFVPGSGTVIFNGTDMQYVFGSTNFNNVTASGSSLDYTCFVGMTGVIGALNVNIEASFLAGATLGSVINTGGWLYFNHSYTFTIASYTGGGNLFAGTGSHVIITDLSQDGLYGTFRIDGAHLEVHQDAGFGQYPDLNGNLTISNNGIVDIYGGVAGEGVYFGYSANASLTMDSGELNTIGKWINIANFGHSCDFNISGGTIHCYGNWYDNWGIFDPTGGTVELTGSADSNVLSVAPSWFYNLKINKIASRDSSGPVFETHRDGSTTPVTRSGNLSINDCTVKGSLTVQAANVVSLISTVNVLNAAPVLINAGTLDLNSQTFNCTGNVSVSGTLKLTALSSLHLSSTKSLDILNGGTLLSMGTSAYPATITHNTSGYYALNVENGGTIGANYTIFEYMDISGVYLKPGAHVDDTYSLNNCTFRNGATNGRLLLINNGQSFTVTGAVFPTNTWTGLYNVSKSMNSGIVYFSGWSGAYGGPTFEQDTYNHIYWQGYGTPPITDIHSSYISATNRIQLNWTYPLTATSYKIYRSTNPYGTFSYFASTTSTTWSQVIPGVRYYYRVTAVVP